MFREAGTAVPATLGKGFLIDNFSSFTGPVPPLTVTFNSNGGSAVASQTVPYGGTATLPTAPAKPGSTFAGWYSDAGLTNPFSFSTALIVDTTLYAKWALIPAIVPIPTLSEWPLALLPLLLLGFGTQRVRFRR
jgi:uncharacterized repeat protein (TIGR02543 family)